MLSSAMKARTAALAYGITPKGADPPFTDRKSPREALSWWLKHRYDPIGMGLVGQMSPLQVAELDAWLTQAGLHAPAPTSQMPGLLPGSSGVLTRAMGATRRAEGPPAGSEVL